MNFDRVLSLEQERWRDERDQWKNRKLEAAKEAEVVDLLTDFAEFPPLPPPLQLSAPSPAPVKTRSETAQKIRRERRRRLRGFGIRDSIGERRRRVLLMKELPVSTVNAIMD